MKGTGASMDRDRTKEGITLRRIAILVSILLAFAVSAQAAPRDLMGKKVPSFLGKQVSGEPISLDTFTGKVPVILTFWSIYCKSCTEEMAALQKLYAKHGPGKMAIIAVNEDADVGLPRVRTFLDRFATAEGQKLSFPILFDEKGDVFKKFGVVHLPSLVYIDRDGTVREAIEGFDQGRQLAVLSAIEKLVVSTAVEPLRELESEAVFDLDVVSPLCGRYRDGKWYQPLDLDESRADAVARARAQGEEYLRREAVRMALARLGVSLYGEERPPTCYVRYGQELRTPQYRRDALDQFLERLNLPRVLEVLTQETVERDRDLQLFRRIQIHLAGVREQLEADGYSLTKTVFRIRFAQATPIEEKTLIESLTTDFPYLSTLRSDRSSARDRADYVLMVHAPATTVVEKMRLLNVGPRKMSVDLLPGDIIEVSMWR
jgi:peroxiredoxin